MREFKITEDKIKTLAETGFSMELKMKEWFPAAFEPEWEEVLFSSLLPVPTYEKGKVILGDSDFTCSCVYPVALVVRENYKEDYKIEDGKIWRRKA